MSPRVDVNKLTAVLKALYEKPGDTVQDDLDALQKFSQTPTDREKQLILPNTIMLRVVHTGFASVISAVAYCRGLL